MIPSAPRRTLIVTNDFPPRTGGIQTFVWECALRQPPGSVVVYASRYPGAAEFDARAPFPVIRDRASVLLPTPRTARRAAAILQEYECTAVWFGAAAPLGLLGARLRRAGAQRLVATTHGHEVGWAALPIARQMLGRVGRQVDVVTVLGQFTGRALAGAVGVGRADGPALARLAPGVDSARFEPSDERHIAGSGPADQRPAPGSAPAARPSGSAGALRARAGIAPDAPLVVCVSRLVPRKGQDVLIRALPAVRRAVPGTMLAVVGHGRDEERLRKLAARHAGDAVRFVGPVPAAELPGWYRAGQVFAMPCRTRRGGLDVEGLGIVYLEASAAGRPVLAGRSGGAPEAVLDGVTGDVVDGRDEQAVATALIRLLRDRARAEAMGASGREWVRRQWTWQLTAQRLRELLDEGLPPNGLADR